MVTAVFIYALCVFLKVGGCLDASDYERDNVYTSGELKVFHEQIAALAREAEASNNLSHCAADTWVTFEPLTKGGWQIYASFSDAELLKLIHRAALALGRKPNQNEIYCIYVRYIKKRFGSWPKALAIAGFRPEDRGITPEEIAERIQNLTESQLRDIFFMLGAQELSLHMPTHRMAKESFKRLSLPFMTKSGAKQALSVFEGREKSCDGNRPYEPIPELDSVRQKAQALGRTPLILEMGEDAFHLWRHCGSWTGALYAAGRSPLVGAQLYKASREYMLRTACAENLLYRFNDKLTKNDLLLFQSVCDLARSLGRVPEKTEISADALRKMNQLCGSRRTVLVELGLEPFEEALVDAKVRKENGKGKTRRGKKL